MSHFFVIALLPSGVEVETHLACLMAPFDETREGSLSAKWDWYQIGGRWSGAVCGLDPRDDLENYEPCMFGSAVPGAPPVGQHDASCGGCQGRNLALKWPTSWVDKGNIAAVAALPADLVPYAVLTPDGVWHEKGEMGWFGVSRGDMPQEEWRAEVRRLLDTHKDCIAVGVDCHI